MPKETTSVEAAPATYDREKHRAEVEEAESLRRQVWELFPLDGWPDMPLERCALGQPDHSETFCRWMELKTIPLGSIMGGKAVKHIIYIYRERQPPRWWIRKSYLRSVRWGV